MDEMRTQQLGRAGMPRRSTNVPGAPAAPLAPGTPATPVAWAPPAPRAALPPVGRTPLPSPTRPSRSAVPGPTRPAPAGHAPHARPRAVLPAAPRTGSNAAPRTGLRAAHVAPRTGLHGAPHAGPHPGPRTGPNGAPHPGPRTGPHASAFAPPDAPNWGTPAPSAGPSVRTTMLVWIAAAVVLVGVVSGGIIAFTGLHKDPVEAVAAIADDIRGWDGITVKGGVAAPTGGGVDLDLVLDKAGNTKGSMTLKGMRVEIALINGQALAKADGAFWRTIAPYSGASLAGQWVKMPPMTGNLAPGRGPAQAPEAFASQLRSVTDWTEEGERTVDGTEGRTFRSPTFGTVVVSDGWTPRLLLVEPTVPAVSVTGSFRVTKADAAALADVSAMASVAATAPSLTDRMYSGYRPSTPGTMPTVPGSSPGTGLRRNI